MQVRYNEDSNYGTTSHDFSVEQTLSLSRISNSKVYLPIRRPTVRSRCVKCHNEPLNTTHDRQTGITDRVVSPTYMIPYIGCQNNSVALTEWVSTSSISCTDSGDEMIYRPIETPSITQNTVQQSRYRALIPPMNASSTHPIAKGEASSLCFGKAKRERGYKVWTSFGYVTIGFVTCKRAGTINQGAGSIFAVANDLMEREVLVSYLGNHRTFSRLLTKLLAFRKDRDLLILINDAGSRDLNKTMRQLGRRLPTFRDAVVQRTFSDSITDGLPRKLHIWFELLMIARRLRLNHWISDNKKLGYWHLGWQDR
jgi:hypothetical protein